MEKTAKPVPSAQGDEPKRLTPRTLLFSSTRTPAVSVYPDSDKIGVWAGDEANDLVFRRSAAVPWSDGEEGWQKAD